MASFAANSLKNKVVVIMGTTGTGKSRLSIDLATSFPSEIINSDKIQVFKGLDIVSNKVPLSERKGVPHHLFGEVNHDEDFTALDFCHKAISAIEKIVAAGKVPIIVGGSNSFLEALVEDPAFKFKTTYECFFIWMDVSSPVLDSYVSKRVDKMVESGILLFLMGLVLLFLMGLVNSLYGAILINTTKDKQICEEFSNGLVDEVREFFIVEQDYSRGIRKAIGVAEMHDYFLDEAKLEKERKEALLANAIDKIKENTRLLVSRQFGNIKRLKDDFGWDLYRIDATPVLEKSGESDDAWNEVVLQPCLEAVIRFLAKDGTKFVACYNH